ncbi:MAG: mechanosensitive ion channel family protein, partial [Hyphomicrobiales bacterium]|nr:mechanosensitive ion channel family protein [Hyphomicrobiales bacterium]
LLAFFSMTALCVAPSDIARAQTSGNAAARQTPATPIPERLKKAETDIEVIANAAKRKDVTDEQLQKLRERLAPLQIELLALIERLTADSAAAKARLDQLGAKPKEGAPAESADVAEQRAKLREGFDQVDALLKRAKVTLVRSQQLDGEITNRRRALLQNVLLKQSRSALHPLFWYRVVRAAPDTVRLLHQRFSAWIESSRAKLNVSGWSPFVTFLAGLALLYIVLWNLARRILPRRETGKPGEFEKVRSAIWVAAVVFLVPSLIFFLLVEGLRYFGLIGATIGALEESLSQVVERVSLTAGIARGVLAPTKPDWRLINIETARAKRLSKLAVQVMCIVTGMRVFEVLTNMAAAPLELTQAVVIVGCTAVALTIALTLYGTAHVAAQLDAELGPVIEQQPGYLGLWRLAIWSAVFIILGAGILGYFNVAVFTVDQIVRVTAIFITAFLVVRLVATALAEGLRQGSFAGAMVSSTFGLHQRSLEQIVIVLSGAFKLFVMTAAAVALLAPLGVETVSIASTLNALVFGYDIGGVRISLSSVAIALGLLIAGYLAARAFQGWLEQSYLPSTTLDSGLQNSISTSARYIGIIAAIAFSLGYLGLNFEKLAFVAGALSLGIGFGLQAIVSNFVSGLILLWERSIKVGDWVVVGSDEGYVRRINVRSTEIETFDRQMVIVPNSNLISGVVKNWVKYNTTGRVTVPVGVSYDTDPELVRSILLEIANTHDLVMEQPPPMVNFADFGDSSLNFELRCYISNIDSALSVRSYMRFEIFRRFKEAGIEIPFPQRDINFRDFDKMSRLLGHTDSADSMAGGSGSDLSAAGAPGGQAGNRAPDGK